MTISAFLEGQVSNFSSAFRPIMTKYDFVEAKRIIFYNVRSDWNLTQLQFLVNQSWKFGK